MNDVNFEALFEAYESQSPVSAKVIERQETGFKVNLFGLEAYMPRPWTKMPSVKGMILRCR